MRRTPFFLSESLLYNSIWLWLLPLGMVHQYLTNKLLPQLVNPSLFARLLPLCVMITILHVLLFSLTFVGISQLIFSPAHQLNSIFSGAFYRLGPLLGMYYLLMPFLWRYLNRRDDQESTMQEFPSTITVKSRDRSLVINVGEIVYVEADKPYIAIITEYGRFLHHSTLKSFTRQLNSGLFVRVHKSAIVNTAAVREMKSRQNGDYDVDLSNGDRVRFSRHYADQWKHLLH
ncbi:MAG: LytTR family DNA-binding domain-containing protein [Bacteroidota bacterium]